MVVRLKFCGAAGTVTGSCHLVEHGAGRLLVDCGLFQGPKAVKSLNYAAFPFDPAEVDAVIVTHAHIDHGGLLPKLVRQGFKGRIVATAETAELLGVMLPDSGYIQESEVEHLNRRNATRGLPQVEPIYTKAEAEAVAATVESQPFHAWVALPGGARVRFHSAEHILGAASLELEVPGLGNSGTARLLFSGDLGMGAADLPAEPLLADGPYDAVICESTYGDRPRERPTPDQRRAALAAEVLAARQRGGNLIIPAFAVERTQSLLGDLLHLMRSGAIPRQTVFVDSPLATKVTEIFSRHPRPGDEPLDSSLVRFVPTPEESARLTRISGGAIILAASGMCEAGRIRHHLAANLWRPEATILLAGYMEGGTLGAVLAEGHERTVRIQGEEIAVRAQIRKLDTYSGHADRTRLLHWLGRVLPRDGVLFLVHGNDPAREGMRAGAVELGINAARIVVPKIDDTYALKKGEPAAQVILAEPARRIVAAREAAHRGRDWHNDYASLILELRRVLDKSPDDRTRVRLLQELRAKIDAAAP